MSGASPWSVKGISAEERELAKQAARRAGVPIGQWLSRQIREAAELERSGRAASAGSAAPHAPPGPTAAAWRSVLAAPPQPDLPHPPPVQYAPPQPAVMRAPSPSPDTARLRELERRVQDLRDLEPRMAALEKLERRITGVAAELTSLGARVAELETRAESRVTALSREMKGLTADVEDLRSRPAAAAGDAGSVAASTAPIERAVMRLAERVQRVEELTLPEERGRRGLLSRLFRR